MAEVSIKIGGREFTVACQDGEEHYLQTAAGLLDAEATTLTDQIGRMPAERMLLMAGLMLADKTAGVDDQHRVMETTIREQRARIEDLESRAPDTVEVPVVPQTVTEALAELAARAEAMADAAEERAAG